LRIIHRRHTQLPPQICISTTASLTPAHLHRPCVPLAAAHRQCTIHTEVIDIPTAINLPQYIQQTTPLTCTSASSLRALGSRSIGCASSTNKNRRHPYRH
jgi:hypothetical protein